MCQSPHGDDNNIYLEGLLLHLDEMDISALYPINSSFFFFFFYRDNDFPVQAWTETLFPEAQSLN